MFTITLTHDPAVLDGLREEWIALHDRSDARGAALTWHTIAVWCQHFGHTGKLWLMLARDSQQRLCGIAPLMLVKRRRKYALLPWRQIEFIGASHHHEHLDFIVERGLETQIIPLFLEQLMQARGKWDVLRLTALSETPTLDILQQSPYVWEEIPDDVLISPYFKLPADLDTWLASVSKNRRKKQRGYLRQLDSDFADNWSITAVTKPEELRAVLDHLVTLHQAKWIDTNKRGAFYAYGNMIPYYYDLMRVYLEQGWLRLYQLKVAGKTGVVLFSYQVRGRAYDQISGYDNTLTEIPIGHVMTQHSIEQAIQNGCDEYSFMWGEEPYKYSFGAENRYQQAFQIVRSPRVRFQNALLKRLQELRQRLRKPEPEVVPAPEPDSSTQE